MWHRGMVNVTTRYIRPTAMRAALEALNHLFSKTDIFAHLPLTLPALATWDSHVNAQFYTEQYVMATSKFDYGNIKARKRLCKFFSCCHNVYPPIQINSGNTFAYRIQNNASNFTLFLFRHSSLVPQKNSLHKDCGKLAWTRKPAEKICIIG